MSYLPHIAVTKLESNTGTTASGSVSSTAGNALFSGAAVYETGGTAATITTSGGGTWTRDSSTTAIPISASINTMGAAISSCPSATGGSQTITLTRSAGSTGVIGFIYEFVGNPRSGISDATSPAVKTGTSTTVTSNTLANVTTNALFISVMVDDDGANPSTLTGTASGWTFPAGGKETDGSSYLPVATGYKIVSSVVTENSAWTVTSSNWGALIAVYKGIGAIPPFHRSQRFFRRTSSLILSLGLAAGSVVNAEFKRLKRAG